MSDRRRAVGLLLATCALLALSVWLLTYDVHSDIGQQYGDGPDTPPGDTFCGSAYDIA